VVGLRFLYFLQSVQTTVTVPQIRPRPLPSIWISIPYSLVILSFYTIVSGPPTISLIKLLLLLIYSVLAAFQRIPATDPTLLIHYSAKKSQIIRHVLPA
jgi:hypothetical protein